jgi:hypothetical protein
MPDLAAVRANSARLTFDYAGARFTLYYRPVDVDDSTHAALRAMRAEGEMDAFYAELARLVDEWDVTDHGAPVPTTADGFKSSGIAICGRLMNAILADVANPTWAPRPAPASGTPWSNGSSTEASSAPPPTTSPSSSTPAGRVSPPGTWPDSPTPLVVRSGSAGPIASVGAWRPPSTSSP